jgi:hypothetical protein
MQGSEIGRLEVGSGRSRFVGEGVADATRARGPSELRAVKTASKRLSTSHGLDEATRVLSEQQRESEGQVATLGS